MEGGGKDWREEEKIGGSRKRLEEGGRKDWRVKIEWRKIKWTEASTNRREERTDRREKEQIGGRKNRAEGERTERREKEQSGGEKNRGN